MDYYLTLAALLFVYMSLWFVVSLIRKRNDVADIAWGLGFVLLAWVSLFMMGEATFMRVFVSSLVTVWGVRLALHIYLRNRGKSEDYRYLEWRKQWGRWFYLRSYTQVYLLQGFFLYLIILPVLVMNRAPVAEMGVYAVSGFVIWVIGFLFESVGDWQLTKFIKNPNNKGKLMTTGLWAYTRHPNYFGEVTQWWGIWLMALSAPFGWITIVGPITITTLILKVSGIPMLEKKMVEHPDFIRYKETVSVFFPMPPKR